MVVRLANVLQFNLEFELRMQQFIEMVRTGDKGKYIEAMLHAKKYLTPYMDSQSTEIHRAAGLLAFPKDTKAEPYKVGSCALLCLTPTNEYSRCICQVAGRTLLIYSCVLTMNFSLSLYGLYYILRCPPGYQL